MANKKSAQENEANETVVNERKSLHALTFSSEPRGQSEMSVGLPGGGRVFMDFNAKAKPGEDGAAYAEMMLTETEAAEWSAHYALYGLELKPIAHSKMPKPKLSEPQEP